MDPSQLILDGEVSSVGGALPLTASLKYMYFLLGYRSNVLTRPEFDYSPGGLGLEQSRHSRVH